MLYRNTPTAAYYGQLAQQARQLAFADDQLADHQTRVARERTESKFDDCDRQNNQTSTPKSSVTRVPNSVNTRSVRR